MAGLDGGRQLKPPCFFLQSSAMKERERRGKELQLMKVQEWIFVLGEEEIVMSCDLHISQSAHSLSWLVCACLMALPMRL